MRAGNEPGALRRFWWCGTQRRRLAVVGTGTLLSLVGTCLVLLGGGQAPSPLPLAARFPPSATPTPVDPAVAVRAVSAVDLFEGVDTASGDPVRVRVVGLRSAAPCWQAESAAFARDAVLGKEVGLVVSTQGRTSDGRLAAHVRLPGGEDYALAAVSAGAALVGAEVSPELLAAESGARANHLGLWADSCAAGQEEGPSSTGELPTVTSDPTRSPDETTEPTSAPTDPPTTTEPEEPRQGARQGRPCSPEGALGTGRDGRELTCAPTPARGLRWVAR